MKNQSVQWERNECRKFKQTQEISETNYEHFEEVKHPGQGMYYVCFDFGKIKICS